MRGLLTIHDVWDEAAQDEWADEKERYVRHAQHSDIFSPLTPYPGSVGGVTRANAVPTAMPAPPPTIVMDTVDEALEECEDLILARFAQEEKEEQERSRMSAARGDESGESGEVRGGGDCVEGSKEGSKEGREGLNGVLVEMLGSAETTSLPAGTAAGTAAAEGLLALSTRGPPHYSPQLLAKAVSYFDEMRIRSGHVLFSTGDDAGTFYVLSMESTRRPVVVVVVWRGETKT